jgi:sialidase-1
MIYLIFIGIVCMAILSLDSVCLASVELATEILETKVLCKQPGRYIGWPSAAVAENGDLLAVFSGDRDAHVSPDGKTQMVRSCDGGKTWSGPVTINDLPVDNRDAGIIRTKDGTIIVSWFTGPPYHTKLQGHYVIRSTDNGYTWSEPIRTEVTAPHGPIQLADGRLLFIGQRPHCSHTKSANYNGTPANSPHTVSIEESRDDGRTWAVISTFPVPADARMLSFDEPHMVETTEGKLIAQFRDCNAPQRLWQSESSDGGLTWSVPHQTQLHGYPPHLFSLHNGWLLSTYAKRWPPYGQYACISRDNGKIWDVDSEIGLSSATDSDLGYPASTQLSDGSIWTVYYEVDRPGEKPCLKGTHWRIKE